MTYRHAYDADYEEDEERRYSDRYGGRNRQYADDYEADLFQGGWRSGADYGLGPAWRWRGHTPWQGRARRGAWIGALANEEDGSWYGAPAPRGPRWRGPRANRRDAPGFPVYGAFGGYRGSNEPYWQSTGPHVGKGPRGYRRSDERIREDINDRITENGYVDASGVDVSVENGIVTLQGEVENRAEKRLIEDIADSVSGVEDVRNELRIRTLTVAQPGSVAQ